MKAGRSPFAVDAAMAIVILGTLNGCVCWAGSKMAVFFQVGLLTVVGLTAKTRS